MAGFNELRLQQVSDTLERLAPMAEVPRPRGGWIRTLRSALGMSGPQLARRLGVTQPTVAEWERRETDDAITLRTLRKAAGALGCDLVYAFLPRGGDLQKVRENRARYLAEQEVARVSHSMALEEQDVGERERARQIEALTRDLLNGPPQRLWEPG